MPGELQRLAAVTAETSALVRRLQSLVAVDGKRLIEAAERGRALFAENAELQARVDLLGEELEAERLAHETAEEHRRLLRFALEAALATWCDDDPGGNGADGETYQLCKAALEGKDWR